AHAEAGTAVGGQGGDVLALEQGAAPVGRDLASGHAERGGLAGAVGAEQADDLAEVDLEMDALHDLAPGPEEERARLAVVLDQSLDFEDRHPWSLRRRAARSGAARRNIPAGGRRDKADQLRN